jgi:hypothetical protein
MVDANINGGGSAQAQGTGGEVAVFGETKHSAMA